MICVAMVSHCTARHGGAQQIGIAVRGVCLFKLCFGHDFLLVGLVKEDSSNISVS
jgi:hypothetical protein